MSKKHPVLRIFPTKHPFVKNSDGSESNVKLMTATFEVNGKERHFIIPTMVDGVEMEEDDAISLAKKYGLFRYPSAPTLDAATAWIEKNHGNIDKNGWLLAK